MKKIDRVKRRFVEESLEFALNGKESDRIYTKKVDGDAEAHLVALRSRHRTTYSQVSNQCLDFQGHYQQLKINF
jgi:hypothetical protein